MLVGGTQQLGFDMLHLKGFKQYIPVSELPDDFPMENIDNPHIAELAVQHFEAQMAKPEDGKAVKFEKDSNGKCWYRLRNLFDADTVKVVYNPVTGTVINWDVDAHKLFPHGNNVVELKSVPEDTDIDNFRYNAEKNCVERCDKLTYTSNRKVQTRLLSDAAAHAWALSVIPSKTESEEAELSLLNAYVVDVKRTDLYQAVVKWPDLPE